MNIETGASSCFHADAVSCTPNQQRRNGAQRSGEASAAQLCSIILINNPSQPLCSGLCVDVGGADSSLLTDFFWFLSWNYCDHEKIRWTDTAGSLPLFSTAPIPMIAHLQRRFSSPDWWDSYFSISNEAKPHSTSLLLRNDQNRSR